MEMRMVPSPVKSDHSRTSITLTLPNAQGGEGYNQTRNNIHSAHIPEQGTGQQDVQTKSASHRHPRTTQLLSDNEVHRILCARAIERAWLSYRDCQMFKLLKHALVAAEHSLSYEILRKVSPQEAKFLKDPSSLIRVRFRFGGQEFPPMIYFKIYSDVKSVGVKYISGKKMIRPASEAAQDACDLMGNRKFLEQMIQDALHHQQFRVTDEMDVTTLKDYMQYLNHLDETPATMGGKENLWRRLTLDVLPRTTILYDVVDYLYQSNKMSSQLKAELPSLMSRPVTQEVQLQHIRIISQIRSPPDPPPQTAQTIKLNSQGKNQTPGRRSRQSRLRALKMRRAYTAESGQTGSREVSPPRTNTAMEGGGAAGHFPAMDEEEDWETEADKLFEWSQDLNIEDTVGTPRLSAIS